MIARTPGIGAAVLGQQGANEVAAQRGEQALIGTEWRPENLLGPVLRVELGLGMDPMTIGGTLQPHNYTRGLLTQKVEPKGGLDIRA